MTAESYDQLPYPQIPEIHTHPRILSAAARSLGFSTYVDVEKCHVLELGCATGVNLIAMACELPNSQFVGIDYSREQISIGNNIIQEIGLNNIVLQHLSIIDIDADFGIFDYIVAHGVYSWVPMDVKNKLLQICSEHLSSNGIAYISHNTYPNWHFTMMMRDMMHYHARLWSSPQEKIENSILFAEFVTKATQSRPSVYSEILKMECDLLKNKEASYIFHEYIEEINQPVLFHQFVDQTEKKNLQFIGDAFYLHRSLDEYPNDIAEKIRSYSSTLVEQEQYIDFIHGIKFRKTMLCHKKIVLDIDNISGNFDSISLRSLVAAVQVERDSSGRLQSIQYTSSKGNKLSLRDKVMMIAMQQIVDAAPKAVPFIELVNVILRQLGNDSNMAPGLEKPDSNVISTNLSMWLKKAYSHAFVEITTYCPKIATESGSYPMASSFARYQAISSPVVINLLHEQVNLDEFSALLLPLLDGTNSKTSLVDMVRKKFPGHLLAGGAKVCLDRALCFLAKSALLRVGSG